MAGRVDGTGAGVQFFWAQQSVFATPVIPTTRLRLTLPEDLKAVREYHVSEEPTPQRGRASMTEISRTAEGPLNFEVRTEGMGPMYKGALGSDEDVVTLTGADGGVRCQVDADYTTGSTYLYMDYIDQTTGNFPASGRFSLAYRTGGVTSAQLTSVANVQYTSIVGNAFVMPSALAAGSAIQVEDFVFLYDAAYASATPPVQTHVYAAGDNLNTISTYGILRDIETFYYYSCKTQTLTETYDNQAVVTGSIEVFAGDEFSGGVLNAQADPTDTQIEIDDVDNDVRNFGIFYPSGGTIWIGDESAITFTGVDTGNNLLTGIPAGGTGSITEIHYTSPEKETVSGASITSVALGDLDDSLASYNAGTFTRVDVGGIAAFAMEVLSCNYTVTNNLATEKVPLGTKERAALPAGIRDTTITAHIEFDSPEEYNRVIRGTDMRFEIRGIDALTDIGATGVSKRNDTIFQKVRWTEGPPVVSSTDLIEYDLNGQALVGARWPEIIKVLVNSQASATAGG